LVAEIDLFHQTPQQVQLGVVSIEPNKLRAATGSERAGVILFPGRAVQGGM